MTRPNLVAIRSYRIYFRDGLNTLSPAHEVNLGSDEEARLLAEMMLGDRPNCSCAEVWDRARLVDKLQGNRSVEPQQRSIQVDWRDIAR